MLGGLMRNPFASGGAPRVVNVAVVALLPALLAFCKTPESSDREESSEQRADTEQPFPVGSTCANACANTTSDESWAVCWSCKCKQAMDGWLPKPEEIGCGAGKELEIFTMEEPSSEESDAADGGANGPRLKKVTTPVDKCLNPDRLRNDCTPGSRLVQVEHGDIYGKAICKRESFLPNYQDMSIPFTETGIILHNNRTGATCFYDDWDNVVSGQNQPDIDLTNGEPAKVRTFLDTYYRHEGEECISCHDNDPFMYSPHLSTAGWKPPARYTFGPYHLVSTKNVAPKSVHKHLVSPAARACTSCHRISDGRTCSKWVDDAVGSPSIASLQSWMTRDNGKWGVVVDERGFKWSYPFWMGDFNYMFASQTPPSTEQAWNDKYGAALDIISTCCKNPNAPGCEWKDIPPL
jgi:hypothetical protein